MVDNNQFSNISSVFGNAQNNGMNQQSWTNGNQNFQNQLQLYSDNSSIASELSKQGISLKDLVAKASKVDEFEARLKKLEDTKDQPTPDEVEIWAKATRNDPDIKEQKQVVDKCKTKVIARMCMDDEDYRREYNKLVSMMRDSFYRQPKETKE